MSRAQLKSLLVGIALLASITSGVVLFLAASSLADDKPAPQYAESGSVLSAISKHGHFYQVATDKNIYLLMCTKVKAIQFGEPECKIGDKPIATGDTVHFRIDGDWAYMPPIAEGTEEKLRILTTELKIIPPLPAAAPPANAPAANAPATASAGHDKGSTTAREAAIVIGTGLHVKGQHGVGWSTTPGAPVAPGVTTAGATAPLMSTAPVTAIPVTGGAPVIVIPTAPAAGGVVTGVPVTGGPPITAIPVAPVMGVPAAGAPAGGGMVVMGGSKPQWVHVLRIQTAGKIYQLECSTKPCALEDKEIALGDTLTVRIDQKHAYLSSAPGSSGAEEKLKILNTTEAGSASESEQR
ncbi:MAG: hypothetical protein ABSF93_17455 [Candidatus Sulfotelmatobacter sp.]|jgi:hypothetical protein